MGFTLVETIVVLTIVSLIAGVLAFGFERVLDVRVRLAAFLDGTDAPTLIADWFRSTVGGLLPDRPPNAFVGGPRGFAGLSVAPLDTTAGVPTRIAWALDYDATSGRTILHYRSDGGSDMAVASWPGDEGGLEYCDRALHCRANWPGEAAGAGSLPLLVRLDAVRGTEPWPILAAPQADRDPLPPPARPRRGDVMREREQGFVIVAVLWFVALLALAAVAIAGWLDASLDRAFALKERAAARAAAISATDGLVFDLVAGHLAPGAAVPPGDGAAPIALDGRPYRVGGLVVRLQDEAGLCNLNGDDGYLLPKLLRNYGVPADRREALLRGLRDYVGTPRPGVSADAIDADYAAAGLPAPRRAPLLTPWEALRALAWSGEAALWQGETPLSAVAGVGRFAGVNPNTAPREILDALPGLDAEAVARLVAYRAQRVIADAATIEAATGLVAADPHLAFLPANSVRLEALAGPGTPVRTSVVRLTPLGRAPYRIDYVVELPADSASAALQHPEARATLPALPSP